jgi:hypothetical protein
VTLDDVLDVDVHVDGAGKRREAMLTLSGFEMLTSAPIIQRRVARKRSSSVGPRQCATRLPAGDLHPVFIAEARNRMQLHGNPSADPMKKVCR